MNSISPSVNYVPTLKESVLPRKILACMPILGAIICWKSLWNLESQYDNKRISEERKIEILDTANHYHKCNIAHRTLAIALLTASVAYGIFTGGIGFFGIALAVGIGYYLTHLITNDAYNISENNRHIQALKTNKTESAAIASAPANEPVESQSVVPQYPSLDV